MSILFRSSIFTFSFTYCSRVHRFICNTIIICSRGHYRQLNIHVNFKSLDFFIIFLSPITFCIVYSFLVIEWRGDKEQCLKVQRQNTKLEETRTSKKLEVGSRAMDDLYSCRKFLSWYGLPVNRSELHVAAINERGILYSRSTTCREKSLAWLILNEMIFIVKFLNNKK